MTKASRKISVVIVDNQEVVRIGVRAALEIDPHIVIVAEGATEVEAFRLVHEYHPEVLLLGLNLPTVQKSPQVFLPSCETVRCLVKATDTKILVLSRYSHLGLIRAMLGAGACGVMLKDEAMNSCAELAQAIVKIARNGKLPLSQTIYEKLHPFGLEIEDVPALTARRIEFMQAIADHPHLTVPQVAHMLNIAESTLRNNLSAVSRALETPHLNGALIECLRLGLVSVND